MTHEDAGHYAAKHPQGTEVSPEIRQMLQDKIVDGKISCAAAHAIAAELNVAPEAVGIAIDLMEGRIHKCQLGLFGYQPEKRTVKPTPNPSPDIVAAVKAQLANNRISCAECWKIAEHLEKKKMDVSNVCEGLGIKVNKCQIGAF
jgi:hypothetical protein